MSPARRSAPTSRRRWLRGVLAVGVGGGLLGAARNARPPAPAARPAPDAAPEPAPTPAPATTICVDPGHPSDYSGGAAAHGLREVDLNWQVALVLRDVLEARGLTVVMTKSELGQVVSNRRRAEIANEAGAALMLRLHCDAGAPRGFALFWPEHEGTRDGDSGPPPDVRTASGFAARALHAGLRAALTPDLPDRGVFSDRVTSVGAKQGALTGSIYARVPAVTVEMVTLTQKADAEWLRQAANQRRYAEALADGVERFQAGEGD